MKGKTLGQLYKDGEIIIKQGTSGKCLYVIQEGRVEVIKENGEKEIKVAELGETEYKRLRMGVGRPPAGGDVSAHVLSRFNAAERALFGKYVETSTDALEDLMRNGAQDAMSRYNNRGLLTK